MTVHQSERRICAECGDPFPYTEPEQRFRAEHGMSAPIRCPACRSLKRALRNSDLIAAGTSPTFGGYQADDDRRRQARGAKPNGKADRFPAICAACGTSTMVPFMPRGDRPVYCRSCFNARRGR